MDRMSILSWNIRGLGRSENRLNLRDFIFKWKPDVICLQEILISSLDITQLKEINRGEEMQWIFQLPTGHSGGLITFWKEEVLELVNAEMNPNWIGTTFKVKTSGETFSIFNVYAPQSLSNKMIL